MGGPVQTTGILRGDIKLLRGETLLLFDPSADAYFKISERTADIIAYFSDDLTFEAMEKKLRYNGIQADQEELLSISMFLRNNGLLIPRYGETALRQDQMESIKKKTFLLRLSSAYLFFRLPPIRPEKLFQKIAPWVSLLVSRYFMLLWILPAVFGYLLALRDSGKVLEEFVDTLSWAGLVKYAIAILIVKVLHEAAHSLAAIRFNCRVRGIGLGFIFFVPRLYTDTTDSWRLPRKQRLLIDGAGILAELIVGGIAALFWNLLPPGAGRSTMFYLFAISTLSSLLVNGNVFIRYDGYYILSDLLGIENLMARSTECVKRTWRWYILRLGAPSGEEQKGLLICYGISSFIYRIFLYTSICLLIYYKFIKVLAVILLILEIYSLLIYPFAREVKTIWQLSRRSAGKAAWILLFLIIAAVGGILFAPLSWGIRLPGETVPAQRQPATVEESGFLRMPLYSQARAVTSGEVIAELESPQLRFAIDKIQRTIDYDQTLFDQQELDEEEFARNGITAQKLHSDRLALKELLRRKKNLKICADQDGYFVPAFQDLSAGAFLRRHTMIGEIVSAENRIYAYAADDQVGKIYPGQNGTVIFSDDLTELSCRVLRIDPVAAKLKGSPILQFFGGEIASYQLKEDEFSPVQTLYCIELELPSESKVRAGRSVQVKLVHTEQLYPHIRNMILAFFRKEF